MRKVNSLSASQSTRQCFLTKCPRNTNLLNSCCPSNELIFFQCNHLVFYTKYYLHNTYITVKYLIKYVIIFKDLIFEWVN